jgi:transketolase
MTAALADKIKAAQLRLLKMHFKAGVGHIGGNLSCLDAILTLFHERLTDKDHFLLSKGHGAGALYTALWSVGHLAESELDSFHGEKTHLAGHPCPGWSEHIPFATGSLGHGFSLAAGLALGRKLKEDPSHVYCLTSDGEWQEGSTWEALIFAAHHRLSNLTVLVDANRLQGFGTTDQVASMQNLEEKIKGFDVDVFVADGHKPEDILKCLDATSEKLKIVFLNTVKGHGVSFMENQMEWHYLPLSQAHYDQAVREIENS